ATFYASSDLCGAGGMHHQQIHATFSWRNGPPCYDCIFAKKDPSLPGFCGCCPDNLIALFHILQHFLSLCLGPVVQRDWR
ncbi:hypothetical protein HYDPIDRAFT_103533, partial [Hydnomerulius pinastri MD-312]